MLFTRCSNDCIFKTYIVNVSSETRLLSLVKNKQWFFSPSYSFSASAFTLIEDLLYLPVQSNFKFLFYWLQYTFYLEQKFFAFPNQNQQCLGPFEQGMPMLEWKEIEFFWLIELFSLSIPTQEVCLLCWLVLIALKPACG